MTKFVWFQLAVSFQIPIPIVFIMTAPTFQGPSSSFKLDCHLGVGVGLACELKKKLLYVIISNLCSVYMKTISRMYQIMSA